jgi:hypothetical protein
MEFLVTMVIRSCRALTGCDLKPTGVQLIHQPSRRCPDLERYFGCRIIFGAGPPARGGVLPNWCERVEQRRTGNLNEPFEWLAELENQVNRTGRR